MRSPPESTAKINTTSLYLNGAIGGKITVGLNPTPDTTIEVWAYCNDSDTPTYPDVLDGVDSDETITSVTIKNAAMRLVATLAVDVATSDRTYAFAPVAISSVFPDFMPRAVGTFVTHNTGVNLNNVAGNHQITLFPWWSQSDDA